MKLDKYVEETIKQVISGVNAAKSYAEHNGASINPGSSTFRGDHSTVLFCGKTGVPIQQIEFDVAVSVSESNNESGNPEISVGAVSSTGISQSSENQNSSINRIKFSIPVLLPITGTRR